jgi:hypothetical protein
MRAPARNLLVQFLQPDEAFGNGRSLTLDLIDQSLLIIQPGPISSAVRNVQHEPAFRRRRTNRW